MISFFKSFGCLFHCHSPMRDYQITEEGAYVRPLVLIYRCGNCLADLGPILGKDKARLMRAPTTEPYTVADPRAGLGAGSESG